MVVDTSARTADTLYVIGALQAYEPPPLQCSDTRPPNNVSPAIVVPYAAPPGADLRELLDGGGAYRLDVLVTDDANVIAYAARRANYLVVALPWSVTYVLVTARATPVIGSLTAGARTRSRATPDGRRSRRCGAVPVAHGFGVRHRRCPDGPRGSGHRLPARAECDRAGTRRADRLARGHERETDVDSMDRQDSSRGTAPLAERRCRSVAAALPRSHRRPRRPAPVTRGRQRATFA